MMARACHQKKKKKGSGEGIRVKKKIIFLENVCVLIVFCKFLLVSTWHKNQPQLKTGLGGGVSVSGVDWLTIMIEE